jgi:hypothetical protein
MIIDSDSIDAALNSIAMKFEGQYQTEAASADRGGWGQFLDGPRPHRQIGLYGTSAGLLVLSLADRDETPCTTAATNLISFWWKEWRDRGEGYGSPKFCQNPRLAFCALCLRNTPNSRAQEIAREMEQELLKRCGLQGRWGDYWVDRGLQDVTPRYLATALATFSLSVLEKSSDQETSQGISKACQFLEKNLAANPHLTSTERGLIAAAVLAGQGSIVTGRALEEVSNLAHRAPATLSENHSYFYEYRQGDGEWGRDSVYLYAEIMGGIAGFLPGASIASRLRSESILELVLDNVSNEGFRPVLGVGRISTVEQAWCCLFLALAKRAADRHIAVRKTIAYALLRERRPNLWTRTVLPVCATLAVCYASAVVGGDRPLAKAFTIGASFIIFGLYGPQVIKRFFPGHR